MSAERMETGNHNDDAENKVEAHATILFKGFRLILDQYCTLQDAMTDLVLPPDVFEKVQKVFKTDMARRDKKNAGGAQGGGGAKGTWDHNRTADLIARGLSNDVPGIVRKTVTVKGNLKFDGVIQDVPHAANATKWIRSQAVDLVEDLPVSGPFDSSKVAKPVALACKLEWFTLPKTIALDFGAAEPSPGYKFEIGDPVKCGCSRDCIKTWNQRPMFYKALEMMCLDIERLGALMSVAIEESKAEMKKGNDGLVKRLEPAVNDLDDLCALQCNRAAALFYLTSQHTREIALQTSGLTGFNKNWLRLAHGSRTLFEGGKTNQMTLEIKSGKTKLPEQLKRPRDFGGRGGGRGGGAGGKWQKTGGGYGGGGFADQGGYGGGYGYGGGNTSAYGF